MKTFKFSLVFSTRENTDIFITLDDNIYGIHSKRVNMLYILPRKQDMTFHANCLLRRQFAWNVKSCILGKIRKISSICRLLKMLRER